MYKKRLDLKDKVNFRIYDVIICLTNNCNTQIAQYLMKWRQSDNEMCSGDKILEEKYFSLKFI